MLHTRSVLVSAQSMSSRPADSESNIEQCHPGDLHLRMCQSKAYDAFYDTIFTGLAWSPEVVCGLRLANVHYAFLLVHERPCRDPSVQPVKSRTTDEVPHVQPYSTSRVNGETPDLFAKKVAKRGDMVIAFQPMAIVAKLRRGLSTFTRLWYRSTRLQYCLV
jgi:hypothetical protein